MLPRISDIYLLKAASCEIVNFTIIRHYKWYFITDNDGTWLKGFTWWVNKPVILFDTWCKAFNLSLGRWCICWSGVLVLTIVSKHTSRKWVFTGVPCWSDCKAVYPIGCWDMLQIPWLFLEGLSLLGMVFMSVVSLLNSLWEAMFCICTVLVVSESFLPVWNEN